MKPKDKTLGLTVERLREVLDYDSGSGLFIWKKKSNKSMSSVKAGDVAGSVDNTGYIRIWIDGKRYVAHRLVWLICFGVWPQEQIDHIDGNRKNNRLANLREAFHWQNSANCKIRATNKLGTKGVRKHECGKFQARVWNGDRNIHLGVFDTEEEAKKACEFAAKCMFKQFARMS